MNDLNLNKKHAFDDDELELDIDKIQVNEDEEQEAVVVEEQSDINEEDVKEEIDQKTDNEIINEYLKPNTRCILCTTPVWSLKLNKAYLDGRSYNDMIDEFSTKFEERTGRSLNKSLLHRHFRSHFDTRAAAISEYNKRRVNSSGDLNPSTSQREIFQLATQKYLDELEIFDATAKELITKYKELESIIEEKKSEGKKFGIDELITKQAAILNALNKQAIAKFKALSRVDLENKQGQFLTQLSFIGSKALGGVTQLRNAPKLPAPDEMERIYLATVIKQILARLEEPLKATFGILPTDKKTLFFRELKKSVEGIQDGISADFDRQLKKESQKLLESKDSN